MNNKVTSKEDILKSARDIIAKHGIDALSIRSLAKDCGIATGSMYNYFSSKEDMILAVVLSVWREVFDINDLEQKSFYEAIAGLIDSIQKGKQTYPNFFKLHSLMFNDDSKNGAKDRMDKLILIIKAKLAKLLANDENVDIYKLNETFTKEAYVNLVFNIILSMFIRDIDKDVVLKMIEKTIY